MSVGELQAEQHHRVMSLLQFFQGIAESRYPFETEISGAVPGERLINQYRVGSPVFDQQYGNSGRCHGTGVLDVWPVSTGQCRNLMIASISVPDRHA